MTQPIVLYAGFDKGTDPVTGLTVTVNVYRITRSSGASSQIVTGGSATALGDGVYIYAIAAADLQTYDYLAAFKTTGDVDKKTVWAVYPALANAYATELARLDVAVSSRLAEAGYTAPPAASANASAVRAELATELARLDAAVSSRLAAAGYTVPPDATAIQAAAAAALAAYDAATATAVAAVPDALLDDEEVSAGLTVRAALAAAGSASDPLRNPAGDYVQPQIGYYMQRLANDQVELVSVFDPVTLELRFLYGDDYAVEENRQQSFTTELDLTGATVTWRVGAPAGVVALTCDVVDAHTYVLAPSAANLAAIGVGRWVYELEIVLANEHTVTEVAGEVVIRRDLR